ncbi:hypothetical protein ACFQ0M_00815 [Kitasatospora aburaviensis]
MELATTRLLVIGRSAEGVETVELAHEALINAWDRLRDWVEEDRSFLVWRGPATRPGPLGARCARASAAAGQYRTGGRQAVAAQPEPPAERGRARLPGARAPSPEVTPVEVADGDRGAVRACAGRDDRDRVQHPAAARGRPGTAAAARQAEAVTSGTSRHARRPSVAPIPDSPPSSRSPPTGPPRPGRPRRSCTTWPVP